jgi:DEAD/DEAH box helicase domain-containing protein
MIGVFSAPSPEKAVSKTFHQKFSGQKEATRENPIEIRIRDLGAGSDYHFKVWTELFESTEPGAVEEDGRKKGMRKLIVRRII